MEFGNSRKKKRLGDILVDQNVINEEQLKEALSVGREKKLRVGEALIELGIINETDIAKALQKQLNLGFVSLQGFQIEPDVLNLVEPDILKKYCLIPYEYDPTKPNVLRVAMSDPMDIMAMDDLSIITNLQIEPVVATTTDIRIAIDKYFGEAAAQSVAAQYAKERMEHKE